VAFALDDIKDWRKGISCSPTTLRPLSLEAANGRETHNIVAPWRREGTRRLLAALLPRQLEAPSVDGPWGDAADRNGYGSA
jgi:hypothetical protein